MATERLSRLQKYILCRLLDDYERTRGTISTPHDVLVRAVKSDKGNVSKSLRNLEEKTFVTVGRTEGGYAIWAVLTPTGRKRALEVCKKL